MQQFYYKIGSYYKVVITKCDDFITKYDSYYKMRRLLQIATVQHFKSTFWQRTSPDYFVSLTTADSRPPCLVKRVQKREISMGI